ncbi:GntR family transcriptional regulator [Algicella marina]|uniref:FCD domain-containing protein n=1 Tax=Algicella marina TaxID=2683284 RepID=A0A6P1T3S4_9RHOB|nr:GntR family transcriptional regulator [Algicella marina]QHQ36657.1 FCD domain-containing protein [Algicella marina]
MKLPARPAEAFPPVRIAGGQVAEIVAALRDDIVQGAISPGEPLRQESLADRFGVSRMPIREAIRHLEVMGFVTVEDNKRARVAAVSLSDLTDIYEMRLVLEVLAMRSAMAHLTNAQIDAAARIQDRISGVDALEFGIRNQAFHMELYRPCARPRLLAQIDILFNAADRYLCMAKAAPGQREKSDREHLELLEACGRRDGDAAADCLRRHIGDALSSFQGQFAPEGY